MNHRLELEQYATRVRYIRAELDKIDPSDCEVCPRAESLTRVLRDADRAVICIVTPVHAIHGLD